MKEWLSYLGVMALGTVLAEVIGSVIALEILLKGRSRIHVRLKDFNIDLAKMWTILKIGIPASFQMVLRGFLGIVLITVVAKFGTTAVAAFGVGMRLHMLAMMPGFALGMAAGTLVGQNLGAGQPARAVASAWTATAYYVIFMLFMTAVFVLFAPYIIMGFNNNADVIRIGADFLKIASPGYVFIALGLILGRALSGAGDTISPLVITFLALWVIQIPLAVFLAKTVGLGGIWYAFLIAYTFQGLATAGWFMLGRWKGKRV